jgi:chromosome segregation ATPase
MRINALVVALSASSVLALGCTSQEEPAMQAVASAEAALDTIRPDASKYVPQQLQAADARLAELKAELAKKDYHKVLTESAKFKEQVNAVEDAAVARQTALAAATREWQDLNEEVPKLVDAIQNRVDNLKGGRLPKDVKKETFESAKSALEEIKSTWAEATNAANAGNTTEAADKGRVAQAKAKEVSQQLGVSA